MADDARGTMWSFVRTLLPTIRGVEAVDLGIEPAGAGRSRITVKAKGWSPSLHGVEMSWIFEVDDYRPAVIALPGGQRRWYEARLTSRLRPHLLRQEARAHRAAGSGIASPIDLPASPTAASKPETMRVDHMLMDREPLRRLVANIMASKSSPHHADRRSLMQQVAYDAAAAHEGTPAAKVGKDDASLDGHIAHGQNALRKLPVMVREVDTAGGTEAALFQHMAMGGGDKVVASFDGAHLILLASLPETVLTASIGHLVGEIVETGTPIDMRRILDGRTTGSSIVLTTETDLVRIGDLPISISPGDIEALERVA